MSGSTTDKLAVRRELTVMRSADQVWLFVREMGNWASLMPGYIAHESLGPDDSEWTLQVDIGPFKRPVAVDVHVLMWDGPHRVTFQIKGKHDPFIGSGSFTSEVSKDGTLVMLQFRAEPTGSMAKVLAPLVPQILRQVADHFSANLKASLNLGRTAGAALALAPAPATPKPAQRGLWSFLIGRFLRRSAE